MKKYIYMAVAAIAALSSCTPDETGDVNTNGSDEAFIATIETGNTRTTLGTGDNAGKVFWESGDKISINGVTYTGTPDKDNATKATFEKDGDAATGTTFSAYYPASLYDGTNATLPAEQTYEAGKISNLPMYAQSDDHNLVFKNLCGVLAITVNSSDFSEVSSIDVYSDNWMNGNFTVDASNNYSMSFSGDIADANKKVTLSMGTTPMSITTSQVFYVAIPAGTHNLIFKVNGTLNSATTSKVMATKAAAGINIVRNQIYSIAFAENAVQLWADGPYWATINVGATSPEGYGNYYEYDTSNNTDYAMTNWGNGWRMPTADELDGLQNCTSNWETLNNCNGRRFSGSANGYTGKSIFLPAAGYKYNNEAKEVSEYGTYWSRGMNDNKVKTLNFKSNYCATSETIYFTDHRSVRAVVNYSTE